MPILAPIDARPGFQRSRLRFRRATPTAFDAPEIFCFLTGRRRERVARLMLVSAATAELRSFSVALARRLVAHVRFIARF